jgi:hypothetical protein
MELDAAANKMLWRQHGKCQDNDDSGVGENVKELQQ